MYDYRAPWGSSLLPSVIISARLERVLQGHAGRPETVGLAGYHGRVVAQRGRRDHEVCARIAEVMLQPAPDHRVFGAERQQPVAEQAQRPVHPVA